MVNNSNFSDKNDEQNIQVENYTIFFLQTQLKNNSLLVYILTDFYIENNFTLFANLIISQKNYLRNLNVYENFPLAPTKNYSKIYEFCGNLTNEISSVEIEKINIDMNEKNKNYYIYYGENSDNKNTSKVKERIKNKEIDFYEIVNGKYKNYNIFQYKVINTTEGCNLNLTIDQNIKAIENKNISLEFENSNNESDKINADCILSSKYNNKIICSIKNEVNSTYKLKYFISYDKKELITIIPINKNENYLMVCVEPTKININNKKEDKLSTGSIIIIIISCIIVLALIIVAISLILKNRPIKNHNKSESKNDIYNSNVVNSTTKIS